MKKVTYYAILLLCICCLGAPSLYSSKIKLVFCTSNGKTFLASEERSDNAPGTEPGLRDAKAHSLTTPKYTCLGRHQGHSSYILSVCYAPYIQESDALVPGYCKKYGKRLAIPKVIANLISTYTFHKSKTLASASGDGDYGEVKIWDTTTYQCLHTLRGHTSYVNSVCYAPDGATLASASSDKTIKIWHAVSGRCLHTLRGHTCGVDALCYAPNGKTLASGSGDSYFGELKIWHAASAQCLQTLQGENGTIRSIGYAPDSKTLAFASFDNEVRIWCVGMDSFLHILEEHTDWVKSVAYAPDGKTLASASLDETIKIWDAATGQCLRTLQGHRDCVKSIAFAPDGKTLASASSDKTVKIWDTASGTCLRTFKGHNEYVLSVCYTMDGKTLASAGCDKSVKVWDVETGQLLYNVQKPTTLTRESTIRTEATEIDTSTPVRQTAPLTKKNKQCRVM